MSPPHAASHDPLRVVIAGGGVAALETLIGLRARARGRLDVTLVSPRSDFVYRPLEVGEPFGLGSARRYRLPELSEEQDATFRPAALARVEPEDRVAILDSGERVAYDVLVIAVGARAVPAYEHGVTFDRQLEASAFDEALADLSAGLAGGVAIVVPPEAAWALPAYEVALMTAAWRPLSRAPQMRVTLITAERDPLEVFGHRVSAGVSEILARAGVGVIAGTRAQLESDTALRAASGRWITADRIVSLPVAAGLRIPGVPCDAGGFIDTDQHGRVKGLDRVYAAGDGTTGRIKQGGLAAQQADAVVEHIAGLTRGDVLSHPPARVLRGLLRTEDGPRYLRAELRDPDGTSTLSAAPLWWPPSKIASIWLSPKLALLDAARSPTRSLPTGGIARSPSG
jgi:sulfide:quinone oxidoreductase